MLHCSTGNGFREVSNVALRDQRSAPTFLDTCRRLFKVIDSTGIEHHVAACISQTPSDGASNPLSGARHNRNSSGQIQTFEQTACHPASP